MKKRIFLFCLICLILISCTNNTDKNNLNTAKNNDLGFIPQPDVIDYIVEGKKIVIEVGQCMSDPAYLEKNKDFKPVFEGDKLIYKQFKKQNCTSKIYDPIISRSGNNIFIDYAEIADYTRCDCYRLFKVILSGIQYGNYNVSIRDPKMIEQTIESTIEYDQNEYKDFVYYDGNKIGITGKNKDLEKKIEEYRNTGKKLRLTGILYRRLPDIGNMQIEVSKIEEIK